MTTLFGPNGTLLTNAIQENMLQREFMDPLINNLGYREVAEPELFPGQIGSSIKKTRLGLIVPNTTPLNPATNNNFDNGLTLANYSDEQYTLSVSTIPQGPLQVNLLDNEIAIANFAMQNVQRLGVAQCASTDLIARNALFSAYMSGNTIITATASSTTQAVDNVVGFTTVVVSTQGTGGTVEAVSVSNPLPVYVNGVANTVTGFTIDTVNTSSTAAIGGRSGTITLGSSVSSTAGWAVRGKYAPLIVRPNGRASQYAIQSSDLFNMTSIFSGLSYLRNNGVPKIRGRYNLYLNATSANQIYQDSDFKLLNSTRGVQDPVYRDAIVDEFLDCRMIQLTQTFVQPASTVTGSVTISQGIERPIMCGAGSLVEGIFGAGLDAIQNMNSAMGVGVTSGMPVMQLLDPKWSRKGFYLHIRPPLDALGQILTQTSAYIGGFVVPTDTTTNPDIIPTASRAYYKRSVVFETATS